MAKNIQPFLTEFFEHSPMVSPWFPRPLCCCTCRSSWGCNQSPKVARPCLEFPGRSTNLAPSKVIKELGSKRGPKGGCLGLVYMGLVCCDVVTFEKKHETGGLTHHVGDCRLTERICNWNDRRSLRFGSEKLHQWQWRYMRYTWDIHEIYMRYTWDVQLVANFWGILVNNPSSFVSHVCCATVNRLTNPWPSCHRDSSRHVWYEKPLLYSTLW